MKLTWLGHACFMLEQDGYKVVVDPYTDVEGYPELQVQAHAVYCSHDHFDHNAVNCVTLLAERENPFSVRGVEAFHDDCGGTARGKNTIHIFGSGDIRVVHLGDLGHQLSKEQCEAIGKVDVLLIPVGGTYTIDAAGAKAVCEALQPRCVVPMHYRHAPYGFEVLADAETFLRLWSEDQVQQLSSSELEITDRLSGVVLLKFDK